MELEKEEGGEKPALQGAGGGPKEDNCTAFLVRSVATAWAKGSLVAVDAGVHLAAIMRMLENHKSNIDSKSRNGGPVILTDGPFEGLQLRGTTAKANAGYVTRDLVDAYLITHPHLDHISGFVVNTASLANTRPKRVAGLPATIDAIKTHIFNNVIWPNLSDENNGAGLVTYMRLVDGGSPAIGVGDGKGYVEICDGLSVKTWSVSHGHCIENHPHRGSSASHASFSSISESPRSPRSARGAQSLVSRSADLLRPNSNASHQGPTSRSDIYEKQCVIDSSAYFIRDMATGREVLMFGDVEADSISLSPRNIQVWKDAAPKIASGKLKGIFIECSYDDSKTVDMLYGHLTPRFVLEELAILANEVDLAAEKDTKKRKRAGNGNGNCTNAPLSPRKARTQAPQSPDISPLAPFPDKHLDDSGPRSKHHRHPETRRGHLDGAEEEDQEDGSGASSDLTVRNIVERVTSVPSLKGIKVVIIHVKEKLDDLPDIGGVILDELRLHESKYKLGCEFIIARSGEGIYF